MSAEALPIAGAAEQWRSLLDDLHRCADCSAHATRAADGVRYCDRHGGPTAEEMTHAPLVRAIAFRAGGVP